MLTIWPHNWLSEKYVDGNVASYDPLHFCSVSCHVYPQTGLVSCSGWRTWIQVEGPGCLGAQTGVSPAGRLANCGCEEAWFMNRICSGSLVAQMGGSLAWSLCQLSSSWHYSWTGADASNAAPSGSLGVHAGVATAGSPCQQQWSWTIAETDWSSITGPFSKWLNLVGLPLADPRLWPRGIEAGFWVTSG